MRVLAMTNLYPTPFHPTRAPFVRHQLRLLSQRHAVEVICPVAWTDELRGRRKGVGLPPRREGTLDGLKVHYPRYYFTPGAFRGRYGAMYRSSVRKTFEAAARDFQPDLVFTPWAYPDGWAAVELARRAGLPVVVQVHGSDVLLLDQTPGKRAGTIDALRRADGIVAVSRDIRSRIQGFGVESDKIRVVIDGVDRSLFRPGPRAEARERLNLPLREPLILFIGNLLPVKAVDVLLKAMQRVKSGGQEGRLIVIGQGPLRQPLEAAAHELGIADAVEFRGALPQAELPEWYRAADLFVLPSHSEGVPNVLLEASASGTPWVASRVGGIPEIAELGDSRLVTPNAPDELATAIREHLGRPGTGSIRGKAREEAVRELEEFLTMILGQRAGPSRGRGSAMPST